MVTRGFLWRWRLRRLFARADRLDVADAVLWSFPAAPDVVTQHGHALRRMTERAARMGAARELAAYRARPLVCSVSWWPLRAPEHFGTEVPAYWWTDAVWRGTRRTGEEVLAELKRAP